MTFENKLKEYAALLIRVGLSIGKDDELIVNSPVEAAPFARLCVDEAYAAGAANVTVIWSDDHVTRAHFLNAADRILETTPAWRCELLNGMARRGVPHLFISASDPMNLAGVAPERLLKSARTKARDFEEFYRLETSSFFPWCIASVPIQSWADKVFPDKEDALSLLWDAVFAAVRIKGDGTAVDAWREHLSSLRERTKTLNSYRFRSLHYKNSLGTDLTVRLPEGHVWLSGEERTPSGRPFVANMPTEEIFTAPLKTGVDGVVYAALPLIEDGNLVRDFHLVLKEGKIVEVHAKEGEEILKNAIAVDEGASYLGEVALIPIDSPISRQGILYYETLFDENASCHLAFGAAYPCLEGGSDMSEEELAEHGLNVSKQHTDFMIGTPDLSIDGITEDGRTVAVFREGRFSI